MKTIDIFIKSYSKDFWLLQLALKTISKNVTGYRSIILLLPGKEKEDFDTRVLPERTEIHYIEDREPGWLFQQVCKMKAYNFSDADYIMFSDSDCFFDHKINLQDFILDDKPEILYTDWEKVGDGKIWKKPTEDFMKETVEWEFMRRNCLIYHRSTLVALAEYEPKLEHVIMSSFKFSEFNALGAFVFKYEKDKYNFINTDDWEYVEPKAIQVWSHASKVPGSDELHLREFIRVLESIMKAFDVPVP